MQEKLGLRRRAALGMLLAGSCTAAAPAWSQIKQSPLSGDARLLRSWVLEHNDHSGRPFAIVDKRAGRLHVFDSAGELAGSTPALMGATRGDHIVSGVGERAQKGEVRVDERTTPAGRFISIPGVNVSGEHVVWVDYESAFAIHRLRPGAAFKARQSRLAAAKPQEMRVSEGCVVVPVDFYEGVVQKVLGQQRGVVYVMPEVWPFKGLFSLPS